MRITDVLTFSFPYVMYPTPVCQACAMKAGEGIILVKSVYTARRWQEYILLRMVGNIIIHLAAAD